MKFETTNKIANFIYNRNYRDGIINRSHISKQTCFRGDVVVLDLVVLPRETLFASFGVVVFGATLVSHERGLLAVIGVIRIRFGPLRDFLFYKNSRALLRWTLVQLLDVDIANSPVDNQRLAGTLRAAPLRHIRISSGLHLSWCQSARI